MLPSVRWASRLQCVHRFPHLAEISRAFATSTDSATSSGSKYDNPNRTVRFNEDYGEWEPVIGIEVHAQIQTPQKLFSGASTSYMSPANMNVAPMDAAIPGVLPVLNDECVFQGVRTSIALNGRVNEESRFDRKHYHYLDLPHGYQITQQFRPLMEAGQLEVELSNYSLTNVRINRLQLEMDTGKSVHDDDPIYSLVDLNRAGCALMEIVSEPDLRSSAEAAAYVKELQSLLKHIGTCDGQMEHGSLRCDVNVSVRQRGTSKFGTRCEVKNINSFKFLAKAIDYEVDRQVSILENGGKVLQQTRAYDASEGRTRFMRSKEDAPDYRYLPDPDIPPLIIDDDYLQAAAASLPELPAATRKRMGNTYELSPYEASLLVRDEPTRKFFEQVCKHTKSRDWKRVFNLVTTELLARMKDNTGNLTTVDIRPTDIAQLVDLVNSKEISGNVAKKVLDELWKQRGGKPETPLEIVEAKGWKQVTDSSFVEELCQSVIEEFPEQASQVRNGEGKVLGFLVGQAMKRSGGRANPPMVNKMLRELLK